MTVRLTPQGAQAELERRRRLAATKDACEADLLAFVKNFWRVLEPSTPFVSGWPLEAMCDLLMAISDGHLKRVIINVPPGFCKSLLLNVFLPAWEWGPCNMPSMRYLSVSYSANLTERDNRRFIRLVSDPVYQRLWGDRVTLVKANEGYVDNTKTGFKLASSIGAGVTGNRADRVLIDDGNNPNDVESDLVRYSTINWLREVMPDRLNNLEEGVIINLQQRVHEQDCTGTLAEFGVGYSWFCIPMEFDPLRVSSVVLRRNEDGEPIQVWTDPRALDEDGELLAGLYTDAKGETKVRTGSPMALADGMLAWPERFSQTAVNEQKKTKGAYAFCNPHEAPVLMGDLTQKPIGEVKVGEHVVGFDLIGKPRRMRSARVSAISAHRRPVVKITLSSGKVIRCTGDHKWFTGEIMIPYAAARRGQQVCRVFYPDAPEGVMAGLTNFRERAPKETIESIEEDGSEIVYGLTTETGNYVVWGLASANSGQYQQSPTVRGGGFIRREWWGIWTDPDFPPLGTVVASLDTALEQNKDSDYNALTVWGAYAGIHGEPKLILRAAWRARLPLAQLVARVAETCVECKVDHLLIEHKTRGRDVHDEIVRLYMNATWNTHLVKPDGDKVSRLQAVSHLFSGDVRKDPVTGLDIWSGGMITAPDKEWCEEVITEIANFPRGAHDDYCFVAGTLIATDRGNVPIEHVTSADRVLTPLGWRPVLEFGLTGYRPVIARGPLTGTWNHPVFCIDNGWQRLDTVSHNMRWAGLGICDLIRTIRQKPWNLEASPTAAWAASGDITSRNPQQTTGAKAPRGCTSRSGSTQLANRFRRATRSTISTTILLIAALKIWSAYRKACIVACLSRAIALPSDWLTLKGSGPKRLRGTNRKRAASGTVTTPSSPWQMPELPKMLRRLKPAGAASTAAKNLPITAGASSTATCAATVSTKSGRCQLNEPASGAALFSHPSAGAQSIAATDALTIERSSNSEVASSAIRTMHPVFNLTVAEAHCYYANGVLVHNCDSASMALAWVRKHGVVLRKVEYDYEQEEERRYRKTLKVPYAI